MDQLTNRLVIALLVAGAVFFLVKAVTSALVRSRTPKVVQIQAMLAEQEKLAARPSLEQRARHWASARGYTGTLGPMALGLSAVYLVASMVLVTLGLPGWASLLAALPVCWGVVSTAGGVLARRRKSLFDRQLLDALVMLAGQLESGTGIQRALRQVQLASPAPLRDEFGTALQQAEASRDLIGPMRRLSRRYPSRAFDLFIAALQIDQEVGGRIEPSLKEAASMMQRDFSLAEEARAEMGQAKAEFYGILVVIGLIAVTVVGSADPDTKALYFSPMGVLVLVACALWVGLGVWISMNMMSAAGGTRTRRLTRRRADQAAEVQG